MAIAENPTLEEQYDAAVPASCENCPNRPPSEAEMAQARDCVAVDLAMRKEVEEGPNLAKDIEDRDLRANLLLDAAGKKPQAYYQYDGFLNAQPDSVCRPDEDGDDLFSCVTPELRRAGVDVRIQILAGTPKKDAVRILKKMVKWVKQDDGWAEHAKRAAWYHKEAKRKLFSEDIPF